ncbi:hypothetical protein HZA97_09780 [Candidatus Woesearchaeota archaeon]|nr:hypothetical protein [Candidatus Woesearchaeota archaeon]
MRKIILLLLFLAIFISCTTTGPGEPTSFRTGSQGVYINFVTNQPPLKIYDDESRASVLIEVQNLGAYSVGKQLDKIYLSGFDHNIVQPLDGAFNGKQIPNLEGKTAYTPTTSSRDFVEFVLSINPLSVSKYPFKTLATACYGYQTIAETIVCIDPNPFTRGVEKKACIPASVGLGTQGGPIAVGNVNVDARKGKTVFTIRVSNVGGGDVFRRDAMPQCSPYAQKELDFNELDFVEVTDVIVGVESIKPTCKGLINNNFLRLQGGSASFNCEVNTMNAGSEQVRPLIVKLDYAYRTTAFRDVEIVHVP